MVYYNQIEGSGISILDNNATNRVGRLNRLPQSTRRVAFFIGDNMPRGFKIDGTFAGRLFKKGHIPWNKNGHFSEESRLKMRNKKLGIKQSKEFIAKRIHRGDKAAHWKGGKVKDNNYITIYAPKHPNNRRGYIREHRLVMEKYLGRLLKKNEVIHHLNGIRNDNRIENLLLNENHKDHQSVHFAMEKFVYKLIRENKVFYDKQTKELNFNEPPTS